MKRLALSFLICVITFTWIIPQPVFSQEQQKGITVLVDGLNANFDVKPIISNGRTLVPFRAIADMLNIKVEWDNKTQKINAYSDTNAVSLTVGNKFAYRNGTRIALEVSPKVINGRTLVPLRFFAEAFNCKVKWDGTNNKVLIASMPKAMNVIGFYALGDSKTSSWKNLYCSNYPDSQKGNTDLVNGIALGWYSLDEAGNLLTKTKTGWQRPDGWQKVLETAKTYKLNTEMLINMTDGNGALTSLLSNNASVDKAVDGIVYEATAYQGVNLDFEGLGLHDTGEKLSTVRDSFTRLTVQLSQRLKAKGMSLTLTLHAPNSVYKGYDYSALGKVADRIIIMAYDYGSKPEPASLVIQAVEMARKTVPSNKLVLGISVPNETPESILTKVGIAKHYNLQGIALWRLGLVSNDMWNTLRTTIQVRTDN